MKWVLWGPKGAPGAKKAPEPLRNLWFNSTLSEGAPKGTFGRKVTIFAKKSFWVEFHHFHENGWNFMKMVLFRARGPKIPEMTGRRQTRGPGPAPMWDRGEHGGGGAWDPGGAAWGVPPRRGACAESGARREKQHAALQGESGTVPNISRGGEYLPPTPTVYGNTPDNE